MVFSFGDGQALCDHVLAETLAGRNRALRRRHGASKRDRPKWEMLRSSSVGPMCRALAYFGRRRAELGRRASMEMPVVCERFEVVYSTKVQVREK